jgi:hypothetical protein
MVGYTAGERVAAKSGAVVAGLDVVRNSLSRNDGCADGDAVAEGFGGGEDVRVCSFAGGRDERRMGVGPEAAGARKTTLDLVEDQDGADVVAALAKGREELGCCNVDTTFALDGVFSVTRSFSWATSLYLPYLNPGSMGEKGVWYFGFGVAERAPIVRPWKELWKETISCFAPEGSRARPVLRANLMAASLASVPELAMKTWAASRMAPDSRVRMMRSLLRAPTQAL